MKKNNHFFNFSHLMKLNQNRKHISSSTTPDLSNSILTQLETNGHNNLKHNLLRIQLNQLANLLRNDLPVPPLQVVLLDIEIQVDEFLSDAGRENAD
jgi:hypothetical protein